MDLGKTTGSMRVWVVGYSGMVDMSGVEVRRELGSDRLTLSAATSVGWG